MFRASKSIQTPTHIAMAPQLSGPSLLPWEWMTDAVTRYKHHACNFYQFQLAWVMPLTSRRCQILSNYSIDALLRRKASIYVCGDSWCRVCRIWSVSRMKSKRQIFTHACSMHGGDIVSLENNMQWKRNYMTKSSLGSIGYIHQSIPPATSTTAVQNYLTPPPVFWNRGEWAGGPRSMLHREVPRFKLVPFHNLRLSRLQICYSLKRITMLTPFFYLFPEVPSCPPWPQRAVAYRPDQVLKLVIRLWK